MIKIPPRYYCVIANPAQRDKHDKVKTDERGQVLLQHGDYEVRFAQPPFALQPGESLYEGPVQLTFVDANRVSFV